MKYSENYDCELYTWFYEQRKNTVQGIFRERICHALKHYYRGGKIMKLEMTLKEPAKALGSDKKVRVLCEDEKTLS